MFETEGHRLHYVDEGSGSPLLFVHGTPSWSFEWGAMVRVLRGERRCIALDHLGFGLSEKPPTAAYRPADHARRLLAFMRHLQLEDVTLVVHDFGGPIGIWAALEARKRIRGIVAINTWMWGLAGASVTSLRKRLPNRSSRRFAGGSNHGRSAVVAEWSGRQLASACFVRGGGQIFQNGAIGLMVAVAAVHERLQRTP